MKMNIIWEKGLFSRIIFLSIFGIAMGFLEAAVVVYLRELYYPEGFVFPLKTIVLEKLSVEYLREISTIIMLFSMSMVTGRNLTERFMVFLYSFGVWDIFYYVSLKILLDWPASFFTWDILFLIPVVWVGPVLAPIICSLTMIGIAAYLFYLNRKGYTLRITLHECILFLLGVLMILATFIGDYSEIIIGRGLTAGFLTLGTDQVFRGTISHHMPAAYNWYLFAMGEILIIFSVISDCKRIKMN